MVNYKIVIWLRTASDQNLALKITLPSCQVDLEGGEPRMVCECGAESMGEKQLENREKALDTLRTFSVSLLLESWVQAFRRWMDHRSSLGSCLWGVLAAAVMGPGSPAQSWMMPGIISNSYLLYSCISSGLNKKCICLLYWSMPLPYRIFGAEGTWVFWMRNVRPETWSDMPRSHRKWW